MTKWFRWHGLIAFGVITISLIMVWVFLVDPIVKRSIEKTGTRLVGAKVELAEADVHLAPVGITLKGLQVTNPDNPMSNAVEIGLIDFSLDTLNLLRKKIIIDTMGMEGIRLNTPRKTSGALTPEKKGQEAPGTAESERFSMPGFPSFQIPDIHEILAREKLESLEQIKHFREEIDVLRNDWEKRLAQAPDKKTFEQYQERAKKLQKDVKGISSVLTKANDLKKLQKDVSNDLNELEDIQKDFTRDKDTLKKKLDQLRLAPQQDIQRILNTYNLSADGLGNVTQLLFGPKVGDTVQKVIVWYKKLIPLLNKLNRIGYGNEKELMEKPDRGEGVNVRFKETDPLPDLLVRQVKASMIIPAGEIKGEIRQITTDQTLLGLPLEFAFSGDNLGDMQSINIAGALDHIAPDNSSDQITVKVQRYRVEDFKLSTSDKLPVTLKKGLAHLNLAAVLRKGDLDADARVIMDAAVLETGETFGDNPLAKALDAALADVSKFSANVKLAGPLDNVSVRMTSDLDNVLKNAVGKQIKNLTNEFENELRAGVLEKVEGPLADTVDSMSAVDGIAREIRSRLDIGNEVLNNLLF
ncbi:MAG: TIGR03545 family protein [Deltaproteobacteria bacterium]|jgi:uncharacterized protein (TIGR03545 family)|nr:TIGR03545 family protein [Deltaproteobacteria bacterium]